MQFTIVFTLCVMRGRVFFQELPLCEAIFEVHNAGDNVKFDAVTYDFIAITIGKDFEGFQVSNDVLDLDSQA